MTTTATRAQDVMRQIRDLSQTAAKRVAFAACKTYSHDMEGVGWSEIRIYRFSDGSALTDDGRGWLAHDQWAD